MNGNFTDHLVSLFVIIYASSFNLWSGGSYLHSSINTSMTDVDILSSPKWPSLIESLQLHKLIHEILTEDVVGKVIDSVDNWETFYRIYAKWMRFGIRVDGVKRTRDLIVMRRWVCSNEDFRRDKFLKNDNRKKWPKLITRTDCQVALRVLRVKVTDGWIAKEFVPIHNHELVSVAEMQMVHSNRDCSEGMVAQVR